MKGGTMRLLALLLIPGVAMACPKGQSEWQNGCVVDIAPEIAAPVKPSDEKPPEDKMPSWQREGIVQINCPSKSDQDTDDDKAKLEADAQGKKAAGINGKRKAGTR